MKFSTQILPLLNFLISIVMNYQPSWNVRLVGFTLSDRIQFQEPLSIPVTVLNAPGVPPLTLSVSAVDRRRVTLQFRNRTLTRSNALAVKSPDPPSHDGLGFSPGSSAEFLGVLQDRRHSDSYFPLKRRRRKHQMRGLLHPKYSYSPNPRYDI